jgi:diguanylate cyclase (GGDEF)-like protein
MWWGNAYMLGATAVALWTLTERMLPNNPLAGMLSLALTSVGFVACGMVWNASRVFHGRKANWPGLVIGALAWIAAVMTLAPEASALRMTIGAGIVAIYAALTASELWTERRRTQQKRWPAIVVPVLHGLVLLLPILLGDFLRPQDVAFDNSIWMTIFAIELVLYAVGTVFVIFMLVSDRAVTAHKTAASMDPLTGMFNRRGFSEATARVIEREAHAGRPVTVLIFDIDHFKSINDRFGHPAGDDLLRDVAAALGHVIRDQDTVARVGGDEFCVLAPETDGPGAEHLTGRVESAVARVAAGLDALGASAGAAVFPHDGTTAAALFEAADQRLLGVKRDTRPTRPRRRAA